MGAHEFITTINITDVDQAYRTAVENAEHESGHESSNGTISTTEGYLVTHPTPITYDAAYDLAYATMNNDGRFEKWGPAGAIAILGNERTLSVDIPPNPEGYATLQEAAQAAVEGKLRDGEQIHGKVTGCYEQVGRGHYNRAARYVAPRVGTGSLHVTVRGGEPQHVGWLFFGTAAS